LDSTNLVQPEAAIITQVDMDHENFLGHSIAEIASEKAGIIKPGGWVVSAAENPEARDVIRRRATALDAKLIEIDEEWNIGRTTVTDGCYQAKARARDGSQLTLDLPLAGRFQVRNALAAATTARLLAARGFSVGDDAIERGIRQTRWPGRLERLSTHPAIFLDGAHNPAAARELVTFWKEHFGSRRIWLIYGALRDKAVDEIAGLLFPAAHYLFLTEPPQSRAISASLLAEMTSHLARSSEVIAAPEQALQRAVSMADPEDAVFVTGSLYLVGYLRAHWMRSLRMGTSDAVRETPGSIAK
jgi:dihydrofolate synthase / folylpolyglutamate synthase